MVLNRFYIHTATVQTCAGSGPYGDTFLPPVQVPCFADDAQDVQVQGTTVAVTDSTVVYADLAWAPSNPPTAGQFAPNSKVSVNGQDARVISVKRRSGDALGLPSHVQVSIK